MHTGSGGDHEDVVAAINTTPLVDVMLVLLIVFLIAIPIATPSATVALPREAAPPWPAHDPRQTISIGVDRTGTAFWGEEPLASEAELRARLAQAAQQQKRPAQIQIRGDRDVPYAFIARILQASQDAGIPRVAFMTDPSPTAP